MDVYKILVVGEPQMGKSTLITGIFDCEQLNDLWAESDFTLDIADTDKADIREALQACTPEAAEKATLAKTLHDRLAELGADLLVSTIPAYVAGRLVPQPQPAEGMTLARKITREDGRIRWERPAAETWRRIRAFTPWPGAWCEIPGEPRPKLLKVHLAHPMDAAGERGLLVPAARGRLVVACGSGALDLVEVQPEGGRRMNAAQFLAGHSIGRLA
jgi:methionyl-tRNA formyltransferase